MRRTRAVRSRFKGSSRRGAVDAERAGRGEGRLGGEGGMEGERDARGGQGRPCVSREGRGEGDRLDRQ